MNNPDGRVPFLIAGPCSAESREQVLSTAASLSGKGVDLFRAGLWKPRTRPGNFEGLGARGLEFLLEARSLYGLKICTEVGSASHAEACLEAGLDAVWIGARTTTNPFLVQEIASALGSCAVTVFVKNPINADLQLWIGAVERLQKAGVKNLGLVHRGFSSYAAIRYRNSPQWQIAAGMRRAFPSLPMLCDPSHMGGRADVVEELSRRAMSLGMDGLMVEVHCNPREALSDGPQQLAPEEFLRMVQALKVARSGEGDAAFGRSVAAYRERMDVIDEAIIDLLGQRMELSRLIAARKKEEGVSVLQLARWDEVMERVRRLARSGGLDTEFVESVFDTIHAASIAEQNSIIEK